MSTSMELSNILFKEYIKILESGEFSDIEILNPSLIFKAKDFTDIKREFLLELLIKNNHSLKPIEIWDKLSAWVIVQSDELSSNITNWTDDNVKTFANDFTTIKKEILLDIIANKNHFLNPIEIWDKLMEWAIDQSNELPSDVTKWTDINVTIFKKLIQPFISHINFQEITRVDFFQKIKPFKNVFDDKFYIKILEHYSFNNIHDELMNSPEFISEPSMPFFISPPSSPLMPNNSNQSLKSNFVFVSHITNRFDQFTKLSQFCKDAFQEDPSVVLRADDFVTLNQERLFEYLTKDNDSLRQIEVWDKLIEWAIATSDDELPSDVSKWTEDNIKAFGTLIQRFIPIIDFQKMSRLDFMQKVNKFRRIFDNEHFIDIIEYFVCTDFSQLVDDAQLVDDIDSKIIDLRAILIAADELCLDELCSYIENFLLIDKESIKSNFNFILYTTNKFEQFIKLSQFCKESFQENPSLVLRADDFVTIEQEYFIEYLTKNNDSLKQIEVWDKLMEWAIAKSNNELPSDITMWTIDNITTFDTLIQPFISLINFQKISRLDFFQKIKPFKSIFDDKFYIKIIEYYCFNNDYKLLWHFEEIV
ncbi:15889_t:CDS:2 [Rhizophagus irregularis]|nr:15889_t:CDS:2 [Rhizophagus irregularis]